MYVQRQAPRQVQAVQIPTFKPGHLLESKADRQTWRSVIVPGQIIADGAATNTGELAVGRNLLVAFMPWEGYNFEDAILISQRLVFDEVLTSIHIEKLEIDARSTKLGPEEITREVPNVSEESLRHLDETGIVRVGSRVYP